MSQPPLSGGRYQEVDHEFLLAAGDMDVTDVPCPHSSDRRRTRAGLVGLSGGRGSARTAGVDVDRRHPELTSAGPAASRHRRAPATARSHRGRPDHTAEGADTSNRRPKLLKVRGSGASGDRCGVEVSVKRAPRSRWARNVLVVNKTRFSPGHRAGPALKGTRSGRAAARPSLQMSGANVLA